MSEKVTIEGELKVKELLKERGLLMKDLAERLGIARESLTRAIQGNPQYSTLKSIADELRVSVPDLFVQSKQSSNTGKIHGYLKVDGQIIEVCSLDDLERIIEKLK